MDKSVETRIEGIIIMTVDEYKAKYGERSTTGFWNIGTIIHTPEIPVGLYDIIIETIKELNKIYIPHTLWWIIQRKPKIWKEILEVEDGINVAVLCNNEESLREGLKLYYEVWLEAILEFDVVKDTFIPF